MRHHLPCFDTLRQMAEENPRQLEALRRELVDQIISSAPLHTRRRLRGLQFQIDMKRRLTKSSLGTCVQLSAMMLESFDRLRLALNGQPQPEQLLNIAPLSATVIPFRQQAS